MRKFVFLAGILAVLFAATRAPAQNPSSIVLTAPNGGEVWRRSAEYAICWTSDLYVGNVKIQLYNGNSLAKNIVASTPNDGEYNWTIAADEVTGANFKVKVVYNDSVYGESAGSFTITTSLIEVTSPVAGNKWTAPGPYNIQWRVNSSVVSDEVKIDLYENGVFNMSISSLTASTQGLNVYSWAMPTKIKAGSVYQVKVTDINDTSATGISGVFTIGDPKIVVVAPIQLTQWARGFEHLITWYSNIGGTVNITLWKNGEVLKTLASNVTNSSNIDTTQTYSWTISAATELSSDYRIVIASNESEITSYNAATGLDNGGGPFEIIDPYVTVTSPNGGESWGKQSAQRILWDSNVGGQVVIQLLKSGEVDQVLSEGTSNSGAFAWKVPQSKVNGEDYSIRVYLKSNPLIVDDSDAYFTIEDPYIKITSPTGGELWNTGFWRLIEWDSNITEDLLLQIYYSSVWPEPYIITIDNVPFWFCPAGYIKSIDNIDALDRGIPSQRSFWWFLSWRNSELGVWDTNDQADRFSAPDSTAVWAYFFSPSYYPANSPFKIRLTCATIFDDAGQELQDETVALSNFGGVWSTYANTTVPKTGYYEVTSPAGGENWSPGSVQTVKWTSACGEFVNIELRNDEIYSTLTEGLTTRLTAGTPGLISINADVSSYFPVGSTFTISGSTTDNNGLYVVGSVTGAGVIPTLITPQTLIADTDNNAGIDARTAQYVRVIAKNLESYSAPSNNYEAGWLIDQATPLADNYRIRVTTLGAVPGQGYRDFRTCSFRRPPVAVQSEGYLKIRDPYISITKPAGGDVISAETETNIEWATNASGEVKIELLKGNYTVSDMLLEQGLYKIVLVGDQSSVFSTSGAKIRVTQSGSNNGVYDITAVSYVAGTGTVITIDGVLTLPETQYGYANWYSLISAVTANDGSYRWSVPANLPIGQYEDYIVRIESITSPWTGTADESDFFAIRNLAMVRLVSPNGGENWLRGFNREVKWRSNAGGNVRLELYKGGKFLTEIAYSTPNSNNSNVISSYTWKVPDTLTPANDYTVRASLINSDEAYDYSNSTFTISSTANIVVASPVSGDELVAGKQSNIEWTTNVGGDIKIELYRVGYYGSATVIAAPVNSRDTVNSFAWTIPAALYPASDYIIRITSLADTTLYGESGQFSVISNPFIAVTSPNGGETWTFGQKRIITWSTNLNTTLGGNQYVRIVLYKNGAEMPSDLTDLPESIDNSGAYSWSIPAASGNFSAGSLYRVRIYSVTDPTIWDESDANFTLAEAGITLTSPNGGERWAQGRGYVISWTSSLGGQVAIELLNNGNLSQTIIGNTPNSGSYFWDIPTTLASGDAYKIRITHQTKTDVVVESEATFSVAQDAYIRLSAPVGGEIWAYGLERSIIWETNAGPNVKIELYKGSQLDTSYPVITSSTSASAGTFVWAIPGDLAAGQYRVKVSIVGDEIISDIGSLFTIKAPFVQIVSPNGGENWAIGGSRTIKWTSNALGTVQIQLRKSGDVAAIIAEAAPNNADENEYIWTIPSSVVAGGDYYVHIISSIDPSIADGSDAAFQISAPFLILSSPNGGESWNRGVTQTITWSSNIGGEVQILLYKANVLAETIVSDAENADSYLWEIPADQTIASDYKIRILSRDLPAQYDYSDANFTITSDDIGVISPNGGEEWAPGTKQLIKWSSSLGGNVRIDLCKGGAYNSTIVAGTENDGIYEWSIPSSQTLGSDYSVLVTSLLNPEVYKGSDAYFSINRFIRVTSPNGGEKYACGTKATLTWTSNVSDNVEIELYKGGSFLTQIAASVTNSGSYVWTIPASLSEGSDYAVRLTSVNDALITDTSDGNFYIESNLSITLVSPVGGETWVIGKRYEIKWTSNVGGTVNLALRNSDGTVNYTIASGVGNSGSYTWTIPYNAANPPIPPAQNYILDLASVEYSVSTSSSAFTIQSEAFLTILSPQGGENWAKGFDRSIVWSSNIGGAIQIDVTKSGLSVFTTETSNTGEYVWPIPATLVSGSDYKVKVTSMANTAITDSSYKNFTIGAPYVTVTSPTLSEAWGTGAKHTIQWTCNFSGTVNIDLYKNGAFHENVAASVSNTGSYVWTPSTALPDGDDYSIRVRSSVNTSVYGDSAVFSLASAAIAMVLPKGGENWAIGETYTLSWTSNVSGAVNIDLGKYVETVWTKKYSIITNYTPSNGNTYAWTIPENVIDGETDSTQFAIRVTSVDYPTIYGQNATGFTIRAPYISLVSPNGGENWATGMAHEISWTTNVGGTVNIALRAAGAETLVIADGVTNSGSYIWTPSGELEAGSDYTIKIVSKENASVSGVSAATFTLGPKSISVTNPKAGDIWSPNNTMTIAWATNVPGGTVTIDLYQNGVKLSTIAPNVVNSGSFDWLVTAAEGAGYQIAVTLDSESLAAKSGVFAISTPVVAVVSPNGGETWYKGTTQPITWTSSVSGTFTLELLQNNVVVLVIATDASGSPYNWKLPNDATLPEGTTYRVRVTSNKEGVTDTSDADFTIRNSSQIATDVPSDRFSKSTLKGSDAESDLFNVWNAGSYTMDFTVSADTDWIQPTPTSGSSSGTAEQVLITVNYETSGLAEGQYTGTITIASESAANSPYTITVTLLVIGNTIPTDGLVAWLDANGGGLGMDPKGKVSSWPDKSGNLNNATQLTSTKQPVFTKAVLNGKAALTFSGKNRMMLPSTSKTISVGTFKQKTICVAFQTGVAISEREMIYEQGDENRGLSIYIDSDKKLYVNGWNRQGDTVWGPKYAGVAVNTGTTYTATLVLDADNGYIKGYLNGELFGATSGAGALLTQEEPGSVGGLYGTTLCHDGAKTSGDFTGLIAEVAYYNKILTAAEFGTLNSYLELKYGISSDSQAGLSVSPAVWFKADMGVDADLYSLVKRWSNYGVVAKAYLTQGSQKRKPQWKVDAASSRPVVSFQGKEAYMKLTREVEKQVTAKTIYVAFRSGAAVTKRQMIWTQGDQKSGIGIYIQDGNLYVSRWNATAKEKVGTPVSISTAISADASYVVGMIFNGSTLSGRLNGNSMGEAAAAAPLTLKSGYLGAIGRAAVFADGVAKQGAYFTGTVMEVQCFDAALSAEDQTLLEESLIVKYSIGK